MDDPEPTFGLAVYGVVHPDRIVRNVGAQPGDRLVLTKPLGSGILLTAFKWGLLGEPELAPVVASMLRLLVRDSVTNPTVQPRIAIASAIENPQA